MSDNVVKTKNSKGLVALVIILFLMVLGLGGFIVYDKFIVEETSKTTENTISSNKTNIIDVNSVYDKYIENISKRTNIKEISVLSAENTGIKTINYYLGSDNVVYSSVGEEAVIIPPQEGDSPMALTGVKTNLTDVADMFAVTFGNGGFYKLFVIKKDGILYEVDYSNNYSLTPTRYKNVVNVSQIADADASSFDIIDINGNILNKE